MNTWILVADGSRARLYQASSRRRFELLLELNHPAARAHLHEFLTDRLGRVQQRYAPTIRSAVDPHTDAHQVEIARFAERLAATLREGLSRNAFSGLVLVAPPRFLGVLRAHLDHQVARRVVTTLDKDLTAWNERDLVEALSEQIATL
ncbi:MAG: host attachment protein [Deltaproteobacteria bacterium]|nr:host attachment protein [Deltaproteobacteria bacterium]